jgi:hypothetical protein
MVKGIKNRASRFRGLIMDLGWDEAAAAKHLGIGRRHVRKIAAEHARFTRTLELLLAATIALREARLARDPLAGVSDGVRERVGRLVDELRVCRPQPHQSPELPPEPVPPAPEPPPPVFWAPSQRLPGPPQRR